MVTDYGASAGGVVIYMSGGKKGARLSKLPLFESSKTRLYTLYTSGDSLIWLLSAPQKGLPIGYDIIPY